MLLPKLGGSWLLPPRDFSHHSESHPTDHDSDSSGHTKSKDLTLFVYLRTTWRIIYRIDSDAIVILEVFKQKEQNDA